MLSDVPSKPMRNARVDEMVRWGECEAAIAAGKLKHSWLENQVLNKSAVDVAAMRENGRWQALEERFANRLSEVMKLADELVGGFSPAALIDNLRCFAAVSLERRENLKALVHRKYLSDCGVEMGNRADAIKATAKRLESALEKVRKLWTTQSDEDLSLAWNEALGAARALRDELNSVPRGVLLP